MNKEILKPLRSHPPQHLFLPFKVCMRYIANPPNNLSKNSYLITLINATYCYGLDPGWRWLKSYLVSCLI